jgi:hypothetical protein
MSREYSMSLDGDRVRFTPDGRVVVTDAIELLCAGQPAARTWRRLKRRHPKLLSHCSDYRFPKAGRLQVVNREGFEQIETHLMDLLLETAA